jgi:hypothetical protein
MAAKKIDKLLMVSDFNENRYLGVFWSEELIGNDENHWQFDDFVGRHFENGGLVKMSLNANFIITNQFLTSEYS